RRSMETSPRKSVGYGSESCIDDSIRASYRLVAKACVHAGLAATDADDLAQDLWEWLLRKRVPLALVSTPWLKEAVQIYILRFRRRKRSHDIREGCPLDAVAEPGLPSTPQHEANEFLSSLSRALPARERRLLALIREGYSLTEAARVLGIPKGSCDYYRGR